MLTKKIISIFDQNSIAGGYFDLKEQLQIISNQSSPGSPSLIKKAKVNMQSATFSQQVEILREAILANLLLNSEFESTNTMINDYQHFFEMLKSSTNQKDENTLAQHICALHMSQLSFSSQYFVDFLNRCSSVTIKGIDPAIEKAFVEIQKKVVIDVQDFFKSVMNNSKITEKIEHIVSDISQKPLPLRCKNVELKLFASKIPSLYGFSGDGVIYVSIDEIRSLYMACLKSKRSMVIIF
jgi:hypothetical protein